MIGKLFAPLAMKVAGGIIAALLAFVALLLIKIHGLPVIGGGLLAKVDRLTTLNAANVETHRQTKANFRAAAKQATADQIAANQKPALTSAIIARNSDATAPDYYAAVRRYADGMRDSPGKAPRCESGQADLPGSDRPVESADDAADPAGWVSVTRDHYAKVATAAGQAYVCARDGQALIDAGVAVAATDGGD